MSLQFFIRPSEFRDEPELRLMFVCFGGFFVSNINKSSKMKAAAKPGAAVSHQTEDRNMATAPPQRRSFKHRCIVLAGSVAGSAVTNRSRHAVKKPAVNLMAAATPRRSAVTAKHR